MKHKYKINIDQPLPSESKIAQHKDFGRILADYHNLTQPIYSRPLYKNPKAFMGLALILTIAFLVFWAVEQEDKDKEAETLPTEIKMAAENSFLRPPLPSLAPQVRRVSCRSTEQEEVLLSDNLKLTIPAGAFETEDGTPTEGIVNLVVRVASQPADLIAMGLPMQTEDRLINPLFVLDFTVEPSPGGKPIRLRQGQTIAIEQQVSPDFSRPQAVYSMDFQKRTWMGGIDAPVKPTMRQESVSAMPREDGFGVVQYDENGKVIPSIQPKRTDGKEIKVLQFNISGLGMVCLGESAGENSGLLSQKVRFTEKNGTPLRLLTLYSLPKGLNTVQFHFPKTADYTFEPGMMAGTTTTFAGFLADGRLAFIKNVGVLPETTPVHTLQMEISTASIKDLQDLKQLLRDDDSQ